MNYYILFVHILQHYFIQTVYYRTPPLMKEFLAVNHMLKSIFQGMLTKGIEAVRTPWGVFLKSKTTSQYKYNFLFLILLSKSLF